MRTKQAAHVLAMSRSCSSPALCADLRHRQVVMSSLSCFLACEDELTAHQAQHSVPTASQPRAGV